MSENDGKEPLAHRSAGRPASAAGIWRARVCSAGIPPPGLISKQGQTKRGTSATSLQTLTQQRSDNQRIPHHDTHPSRQNGSSSGSLLPLLQEQGKRIPSRQRCTQGESWSGKRSNLEKPANASTHRTRRMTTRQRRCFWDQGYTVAVVRGAVGIGYYRNRGLCRLEKIQFFFSPIEDDLERLRPDLLMMKCIPTCIQPIANMSFLTSPTRSPGSTVVSPTPRSASSISVARRPLSMTSLSASTWSPTSTSS